MSDAPASHRCPFCHEDIATDAPDRVTCLACAAAHHAECFLESEGCATTACKHPEVRVGHVEVPLAMLNHLVAHPAKFRELASLPPPNQGFGAKLLASFGLILACSLIGIAFIGGTYAEQPPYLVGAGVGALVGLLLSTALFVGGQEGPQRLHAFDGPAMEFDPIFGTWSSKPFVPGNLPTTLNDELREQLAAGAAGAEPALPEDDPPDACPDCTQPLETDEPSAFCYHCGAPLVDIAGRWRRKESA